MEANGDFLKLVRAKLGQKYFENVKNDVEKGVEVDDSVFSLADFNADGKVDDDDKNLFEEYISSYGNMFGDSEGMTVEDLAKSLDADSDKDGTVSKEEQDFASLVQNALESQKDGNVNIDDLVDNVANGNKTDGKVDNKKMQELKEQCLAIQTQMEEAKVKYEKAQENKKKAESRRDSFLSKYENKKSKFENARAKYDDIMRKKLNSSAKKTKGKNSKSNDNKTERQLNEARQARDKASRDMSLAQSEYSMAGSNVTYYENQSNALQSQYAQLTESYTALAGEFGSMYDSMSDADKASFGDNPFSLDSSN